MDTDNVAIWVMVDVGLAELIKNLVYEPLVPAIATSVAETWLRFGRRPTT